MADPNNLEDLIARFDAGVFRSALTEAFHRGVLAERARLKRALEGPEAEYKPEAVVPPMVAATVGSRASADTEADYEADDDDGRRAPRGLTKEVVDLILGEAPDGMPLDELQRKSVEFDGRVQSKTIYNHLKRGEGAVYRFALGKWRLIGASSDVRPTHEFQMSEALARVVA